MKKTALCVILLACYAIITVSAEEYDLETYLAMVERNNPDLLIRFKDIELASADVALARSAFLPKAGVQGGYNRNLTEQLQEMAVASAPGGGELIRKDVRTNFDNELTVGIGISQVLFSAGAFSNYNKAKLGRAIREQSFDAARLAVMCAAKKLYARAELALLVVEIRESSERFSLEQYQRVERRRNAGAATEMDLLSAEVDWRTKTDAVMEAKKNAELVLLAFRDLAGIPHSQTIALTQERTELPELPNAPNLGDILANRSDYRALLLARELSDIDRKAARNAFFPEISASFNYALGGLYGNEDAGNKDFNSASFGIMVNIPILAGGARLAKMKAAQVEQEKSIIALSQRETAIESELKELQLRLEEAQRRIESAFRTVETARRAVALAQSAFTNGQATYLTVMDAQDKLDLVWLNFANIGFEFLSAYYDWELAVGVK
ncbi:MAG: TolC family protein [Treponema sp.]|jgi:outer membrane protein TolC|nr:TolC family protein [Treponema sp.]